MYRVKPQGWPMTHPQSLSGPIHAATLVQEFVSVPKGLTPRWHMVARSMAAVASTSRCSTPSNSSSCRLHTHLSARHTLAGTSRLATQARTHVKRLAASHRLDVQAVIPQLQGNATDQTPPDLPSYLFKERIVYLGMSLVPAVTELLLAELLYLQYDDPRKPIYMYINSVGVQKGADKLGYEQEAFAIYDTMAYIKPAIHTIAVGNAFGESAMLLAAGEKGFRAALPSASIMIRQPYQRFTQMQASDIDIYRKEARKTKGYVVRLLSKHTGKSEEQVEKDISRPMYFEPHAAVQYGIIDRVLEADQVRGAMQAASRRY